MATITGTVNDVKCVSAPQSSIGNRYVYELSCSFGLYTASSDAGQIASVDSSIQTFTKRAGTFTVYGAIPGQPGIDSSGNAVYGVLITNTSGTLAIDLGGTTAEANCAASTGVKVLVLGDWSAT